MRALGNNFEFNVLLGDLPAREYQDRGRGPTFVQGHPDETYSICLFNYCPFPVSVCISVDGVPVLSQQGGRFHIIEPGRRLDVKGWPFHGYLVPFTFDGLPERREDTGTISVAVRPLTGWRALLEAIIRFGCLINPMRPINLMGIFSQEIIIERVVVPGK